jgi:hypothetical protein
VTVAPAEAITRAAAATPVEADIPAAVATPVGTATPAVALGGGMMTASSAPRLKARTTAVDMAVVLEMAPVAISAGRAIEMLRAMTTAVIAAADQVSFAAAGATSP